MVLLLAKRLGLDENNQMSADAVNAFYVHQGDMIEVYSDSLPKTDKVYTLFPEEIERKIFM